MLAALMQVCDHLLIRFHLIWFQLLQNLFENLLCIIIFSQCMKTTG